MTHTALRFSFCCSWETKNITVSILQGTDSLYFSYIRKNRQDFPCLDNQRQRNYLYVCWRYLVALHKMTFRNRRCKIDYAIELPFPKETQWQNTFLRDKPSWNNSLVQFTGNLQEASSHNGMQGQCSLLPRSSLAPYGRAHVHAGRCWHSPKLAGHNPGVAPELQSSHNVMQWTNMPPSIFTRQFPKVKATF